MKKYGIISILSLIISGDILAQKMIVETYLEKIHSGYKVGSSIGHETYNEIEFGVFYQKAAGHENKESQRYLIRTVGKFEREFTGIYAAYPIQTSDDADIKVQIRSGLMNGKSIVITPSLLAHYRPVQNLRFGCGIGFRSFIPTIQTSFSFTF